MRIIPDGKVTTVKKQAFHGLDSAPQRQQRWCPPGEFAVTYWASCPVAESAGIAKLWKTSLRPPTGTNQRF